MKDGIFFVTRLKSNADALHQESSGKSSVKILKLLADNPDMTKDNNPDANNHDAYR
ncbi:MAG: hypothetical protein ABIJ50_08005 [Pseudomonadota bacterium]